jgi:hypothetical protein
MTRPFVPGCTILHPKPPTPSDPTAWTYLYVDAAILHATNNQAEEIDSGTALTATFLKDQEQKANW